MDELRELVNLLRDWLMGAYGLPGFWSGFMVGLMGVAGVVFVLFAINWWLGKVMAPFEPQKVTQPTDASPGPMALKGCLVLLLGLLVIAFLLGLVIEFQSPGVLQRIWRALRG